MVAQHICDEPDAIARWSETLEALHQRIAHRFARVEVRERVRRYLVGLFDRVERKNGWQLAEAIGECGAKGVQRLLTAATWDVEAVRDDLRDYVVEHLADEASGILIVDETGFLKKGAKSCGVARQYTGTAGDTVNCQVGVFLAYASHKGAGFIDRALYLPREWSEDQDRRAEAGIPAGMCFASKITLAELMLARAFAAGVPARWVVADSFATIGRVPSLAGGARPALRGDDPTDERNRLSRATHPRRASGRAASPIGRLCLAVPRTFGAMCSGHGPLVAHPS